MRAVMLAAGIGRRLDVRANHPPKVLLEFGGKTLLHRHLEILSHLGVSEITIATGYRSSDIETELATIDVPIGRSTVYNSDFTRGSIVSLWTVREALAEGGEVVLMDGDVLYDYRLMKRLLSAPFTNCFAMDRTLEPGEEPVKICLNGGRLVDFHKVPQAEYDASGEWVGFLRLTAPVATRVIDAAETLIGGGGHDMMYEEAIRTAMLADPDDFGVADITGLPWIEIDFPEDVEDAREKVLPHLEEPGS